ncbi:MAG: hypothetical protein ACTSV9_01690 [Candidatus Thorarchaeota archaeon]
MPKSFLHRRLPLLGVAILLVIVASFIVSADTFRLLHPVQSDVLTYSDANITISFTMSVGDYGIGYKGIGFTITNKSEQAIALDWDRSSITLPNGQISNIMHEGILFIDRNATAPPTTIPPGGKLSDTAFPTRNVSYSDGWHTQSMAIKSGSEFGLYLTLDGVESPGGYNFTFEAIEVVKSESRQSVNYILGLLGLLVLLGAISYLLDL